MATKRVLIANSDYTASGIYRIIEPYTSLKIPGVEFTISHDIEKVHEYDACLIQRPALPFIPKHLKGYPGVLCVEMDDDVFSIPESNPHFTFHNDAKPIYRKMLQMANYIHVSTPELKYAFNYQDKTEVFVNAIDVNSPKYKVDFNRLKQEMKFKYGILPDKKIAMWTGSPTHADSLDLIRDAVDRLLEMDIVVVLCSNLEWLQKQFPHHPNLKLIGWLPMQEAIFLPAIADVFLTPLPDNKFNQSKSELKILEAAMLQVPCVSSDVAPFSRFNIQSQIGNILVKHGNWVEVILKLIQDVAMNRMVSRKAYRAVRELYSLDRINDSRAEFWKRALHL